MPHPSNAPWLPFLARLVSLGVASSGAACGRDFAFLDSAQAHGARADSAIDAPLVGPADSTIAPGRDGEPTDAATELEARAPGDAGDGTAPVAPDAGGTVLPHRIALRDTHMCVIGAINGEVRCRGENENGQLGAGFYDTTRSDAWLSVLDSQGETKISGATAIAVGQWFSCAIVKGNVMCWGFDPGTMSDLGSVANRVIAASDGHFDQIEAGERHICVSDPVYCWGDNTHAEIMDPLEAETETIDLPRLLPMLAGKRYLTLGAQHTCAGDGDGVLCWGLDNFSQCGAPPDHLCATEAPCVTRAVVVPGSSAVVGLGLGNGHSCAIKADRTVTCWGSTDRGQAGGLPPPNCRTYSCGIGVTDISNLTNVTRLALGQTHSCALTASGLVYCWGDNSFGQLGSSTAGGSTTTPVQVLTANRSPLSSVVDLAATVGYTCAVTISGAVYCWGQWFFGPAVSSATELPNP